MELQNLREHLDSRLDKLEDKLDNHVERISKAEASIEWLRGHVKVMTLIAVALMSGMASAIYQYLIH